jgi:nitrogen-specific signal transduction histidine kinase
MLQILFEAVPRHTTLTLKGGRTSAHIHLQIHDLNRVIPPEVSAVLQRSLRATTPEPTDLRPYIAQTIVAAHGGEITICHDAKASLLCTVTLPLGAVG